ncbi:hypothetical protein CGMCC3_g15245 [Colletotrichum fructicola]|nr:uncharacterized protein CGMCC3_g15245 [Colletotrichum fructicola]KAE9568681.1 hypothetical protein CGMCC3_g15245 [Colletotrichum fructicola]KAF5513496.1 hypothetical protein CGCF413_v001678 [Colletotrichum fructicola]
MRFSHFVKLDLLPAPFVQLSYLTYSRQPPINSASCQPSAEIVQSATSLLDSAIACSPPTPPIDPEDDVKRARDLRFCRIPRSHLKPRHKSKNLGQLERIT